MEPQSPPPRRVAVGRMVMVGWLDGYIDGCRCIRWCNCVGELGRGAQFVYDSRF